MKSPTDLPFVKEDVLLYDIAVVGAGPAGYSAAINARKREKSVIVIGQNTGWLARAERIDNYPGMPGVSGQQMLDAMAAQAKNMGAELRGGVVHQMIDMGGSFALSLGADFVEARKVILASGAKQPKRLPGEERLLGRGVSYCGTCDGMLYRGRHAAVIGAGPEAVSEANFLMSLCASVTYFGKADAELDSRIKVRDERVTEITGGMRAQGLIAGGEELPFDGVFIFREVMALSSLLPGLEMDGAFIRVDRGMRTSVPGVFAAGDCTGLPLQVAKAVGEGCIAALTAAQEIG
ncbi:MAG: NAD(P)/FAD-dependent oxidoreductase [Clostridia bacterium]|nr:NAD(P)/FAD-dependent oxidoreductase [Clostridia bacterium]